MQEAARRWNAQAASVDGSVAKRFRGARRTEPPAKHDGCLHAQVAEPELFETLQDFPWIAVVVLADLHDFSHKRQRGFLANLRIDPEVDQGL